MPCTDMPHLSSQNQWTRHQVPGILLAGSKRKRSDSSEVQGDFEYGPLYHFKPWLGFWQPAFSEMKNVTELVLQVSSCGLAPKTIGKLVACLNRAGSAYIKVNEDAVMGADKACSLRRSQHAMTL